MLRSIQGLPRLLCTHKCCMGSLQQSARSKSQAPPLTFKQGHDKLYRFLLKKRVIDRLPEDITLAQDLPENVYEGNSHKARTRVYVWGRASHGALGRKSFLRPDTRKGEKMLASKLHPYRLDFGETNKVMDVSCGYGFTTFAVKSSDSYTFYGTGLNQDGQIGHHMPRKDGLPLYLLARPVPIQLPLQKGESVVKVACGRAHSLALTNTGVAYSLGNNAYGQCGRNIVPQEDYSRGNISTRLKAIEKPVSQIECGQDTSFFLSSDGCVHSCGWSADGQTGLGHYNNEPVVRQLGGDLQGVKVTKLASGSDCALALSDGGEVFGWGNNEYLQLAMTTSETQLATPTRLPLPAAIGKVADIGASGTACFVINERGEVYSWGYGLLGRGPDNKFSEKPEILPSPLFGDTAINPGTKAVSIFCGVHIAAVLNDRGEIFTWGRNMEGALGQSSKAHQPFPLKVVMMARVNKVSCGVDHMVALAKQL